LIRYAGANYNTGLTHVTTGGTVTTGSSAQAKTSGTLYWKIPAGINGTYGYLCQNHGGMAGTITIKDISAI
jgi:plastocyanin